MALIVLTGLAAASAFAQGPPPPSFPPQQLDQLVARIALYPDPLLAQVMAAATYPNDLAVIFRAPSAARHIRANLGENPPPAARPANGSNDTPRHHSAAIAGLARRAPQRFIESPFLVRDRRQIRQGRNKARVQFARSAAACQGLVITPRRIQRIAQVVMSLDIAGRSRIASRNEATACSSGPRPGGCAVKTRSASSTCR